MNTRAAHTTDLLPLQRALVKPLLSPAAFNDALIRNTIDTLGSDAFVSLLAQHGLAPLWFEAIAAEAEASTALTALLPALKAHRTRAIITGQLQRTVALDLQQRFDNAGIESVTFKGVHLGNALYKDTGMRPSADIDVIVAKSQRNRAIQCLDELGADFRPNKNTLCYQTAVGLKQVEIDLHWGFVRPGRTRTEVADVLLQHTEQVSGLRVPNALGTLLALLIHPLASTRPNAPDAKLIRLLDLAYWLDSNEPNWDQLIPALERTGARHTAWLMLTWLAELAQDTRALSIPSALTPPAWKQRWLKRWLFQARDPNSLFDALSIQLGYRSALHTRVSDTLFELTALARAKYQAGHHMADLNTLLAHD